ncbi:hypothetical protein [Halochromatium roseum]|uniref:hypothetical protein n=1 Tax=Halochromatium roseum TaxID=391920 RepID=UPI0019122C69|nr:hypothetical protein [Halochromatium roseum]
MSPPAGTEEGGADSTATEHAEAPPVAASPAAAAVKAPQQGLTLGSLKQQNRKMA